MLLYLYFFMITSSLLLLLLLHHLLTNIALGLTYHKERLGPKGHFLS